MPDTIVSIKKRSTDADDTKLTSVNLDSSRKVSNRRKALQEFYHLQNQQHEQNQTEAQQTDLEISTSDNRNDELKSGTAASDEKNDSINYNDSNVVEVLQDPEKFTQFIQNSPIEDILKLHNNITHSLNSHDAEKKSIIYDNYYELIQLSKVLQNLLNAKAHEEVSQSGVLQRQKQVHDINDEYIDNIFNTLEQFIDDRVVPLNGKFADITDDFNSSQNDDTSIKAIMENGNKVIHNPKELEHEIDTLLNIDQLNKNDKGKVAELLRKLVEKDGNILIMEQLNQILDTLQ